MRREIAARVVAALLLALIACPSRAAEFRDFNSRHYRIHTDLDPILADDLARRMDHMYDQYAARLQQFVAGREVMPRFEVRLYEKQADYLAYAGQQFKNTGGVFMSGRSVLAAFLEGQGRDALRRTIQHEAFHQFAHTYIHADLPVWLNEGMAQVFEEGIWTGTEFLLHQAPPRRIRQLKADLGAGRLIEFGAMTRMSPQQWAANLETDHEVGATQYNQSWAMVYFLVNARDNLGRERYRGRLLQMMQFLHEGKGSEEAFALSFGGNVKNFQDRFLEFARELQPTPEAALIENQGVLADLLTELAGRGLKFESMAAFKTVAVKKRYRLHYTRGQLKWHTDPNAAVYFADLENKPFGADRLFFARRPAAPLPDIVCRFTDSTAFRTRFYKLAGGKLEHEVLVENVSDVARLGPN
jgi:hypothetical protein